MTKRFILTTKNKDSESYLLERLWDDFPPTIKIKAPTWLKPDEIFWGNRGVEVQCGKWDPKKRTFTLVDIDEEGRHKVSHILHRIDERKTGEFIYLGSFPYHEKIQVDDNHSIHWVVTNFPEKIKV